MMSIAKAFVAKSNRAVLVASVGALIAIGAPITAASAAPFGPAPHAQLRSEIADEAGDLKKFYAARDFRPLWLSPDGQTNAAVDGLLERLETAQFDALGDKTLKSLRTKTVRRDLDRAAAGDPEDIARAEVGLSKLFGTYVRAMRSARRAEMIYESRALAPAVPTAEAALSTAAKAPSLSQYVAEMGWMHPFYAPLRDAMNTHAVSAERRRIVWENLERVRALPAVPAERYVLVDAASARLWMYENGKPVDSMKVVVGKAESATPAMAGFIRHAIVNPYWNVPPDLVQKTIANGALKGKTRWLKANAYEVLSDYGPNATVVDPNTIDWRAVAQKTVEPPRVRQRPGGSNFMGKVKYEFPNAQGIYLHDTPERALLKLENRQLSNGCVRLEDADRLGRWLMGKSIAKSGPAPEQKIDLPTLVPVYITYLTVAPTDKGLAFRNDVYGRDSRPQMAYGGD